MPHSSVRNRLQWKNSAHWPAVVSKKELTDNSMVITRGKVGQEEVKECIAEVNGDRRFDLIWEIHNIIDR